MFKVLLVEMASGVHVRWYSHADRLYEWLCLYQIPPAAVQWIDPSPIGKPGCPPLPKSDPDRRLKDGSDQEAETRTSPTTIRSRVTVRNAIDGKFKILEMDNSER